MEVNLTQRKVKIISEIHPQHMGSMEEARMILQSKMGGAQFVKVQLYNSQKLFGNNDRLYLEFGKEEFFDLVKYSKNIGVKIFASIFDADKIRWCEEAGIQHYKIASRTVEDQDLCKKIINTGKQVFVSLGMYDYLSKGAPFEGSNIKYFYCVSKYPTNLQEIQMPDFSNDKLFCGYSDHTIGISACVFAVAKGAEYLEKHFSNNKSIGIDTQMAHVCSMDFNDLSKLREIADGLTLIKSSERK